MSSPIHKGSLWFCVLCAMLALYLLKLSQCHLTGVSTSNPAYIPLFLSTVMNMLGICTYRGEFLQPQCQHGWHDHKEQTMKVIHAGKDLFMVARRPTLGSCGDCGCCPSTRNPCSSQAERRIDSVIQQLDQYLQLLTLENWLNYSLLGCLQA